MNNFFDFESFGQFWRFLETLVCFFGVFAKKEPQILLCGSFKFVIFPVFMMAFSFGQYFFFAFRVR
jgi:hypothetical protein